MHCNVVFCRISLSQTTNFRFFQTKRLCRRQFQIYQKWQRVLQAGKNTVRKGEIARYEHFFLFPQYFQKISTETREIRACLGKG